MKTMACTFQTSKNVQPGDDLGLGDHLYAGEDFPAYPYAMLSDMGVTQLIQVGEHLRERYVDSGYMSGEQSAGKDELYIRSTNMCRTLQSLRGLVAGLYSISGEKGHREVLHDSEALKVDTRPKAQETMFPNGGGPCSFLAQRRAEILTPESYHDSTRDYSGLESKMREVLGTSDEDSVNWITLKEVTTCHRVHGRKYITDITEEEEDRVSDIAGWMWGQLYNDDALNRMAIGRFLHEMTTDLTEPRLQNKKMLVYSGHDSTLVPLLCALRIYDDKWPPYASYLTLELVTRQATGERFVRACYNDQTLAMLGHDAALLPYEQFVARLKQLSIDSDSYWKACEAGVGVSDPADMAQAMKSLQDEVRSTIS
jgi:lysophosphatidic acid phosphatase type 6